MQWSFSVALTALSSRPGLWLSQQAMTEWNSQRLLGGRVPACPCQTLAWLERLKLRCHGSWACVSCPINIPSRKPCQTGRRQGADGALRGQVICLRSPSKAAASWTRPQASRCPVWCPAHWTMRPLMRPPPQGLWAGPPPRAGDLPGIPISHPERPCPWPPGSLRPGVSVSIKTGVSARWPLGPSTPGPLAGIPKEECSVSRKGPRMSQESGWGAYSSGRVTCRLPLVPDSPRGPVSLDCGVHSQCQWHLWAA